MHLSGGGANSVPLTEKTSCPLPPRSRWKTRLGRPFCRQKAFQERFVTSREQVVTTPDQFIELRITGKEPLPLRGGLVPGVGVT